MPLSYNSMDHSKMASTPITSSLPRKRDKDGVQTKTPENKPRKSLSINTKDRLLRHQHKQIQSSPKRQQETRIPAPNRNGCPNGWIVKKDNYGRKFYLHKETERSTWVQPTVVQIPWHFRNVVDSLEHLLYSSQTHVWVRITLETDEDRAKFFSALYEIALDDFIQESHSLTENLAVRNMGDNELRVDPEIPTLAECHKKCTVLHIHESQFIPFIEMTLRRRPWNSKLRRPDTPKTPKTPKTPPSRRGRSSSVDSATAARSQSTSPFNRRRKRSQSSNTETITRRAAWNEDGGHTFKDQKLSMAEYGSLQAKAFREKKLMEKQNAKDTRRCIEANFGRPLGDGVSITPLIEKPKLPSFNLVTGNNNNNKPTSTNVIVPEEDRMTHMNEKEEEEEDVTELQRTLMQVEKMRLQLLKVQEQVHAAGAWTSLKSPRKASLGSTSSESEYEANTQMSEYDEGQHEKEEINEINKYLAPSQEPCSDEESNEDESTIKLKVAIEKELHWKRRLKMSENARQNLQKEVVTLKTEIKRMSSQGEERVKSIALTTARADQRETELLDMVQSLQSLNQNLQSELQTLQNKVAEDSPLTTDDDLENAGKYIERLVKVQDSLRHANDGRIRAEKRAQESSERVVKLTQALAEATSKSDVHEAETVRLRKELELCQKSIEQLNESQDELHDELQTVRQNHFTSLESERVQRVALNMEIRTLREKSGGPSSPRVARSNPRIGSPRIGSPRVGSPRSGGLRLSPRVSSSVSGEDGLVLSLQSKLDSKSKQTEMLQSEIFDLKCSLSRLQQRLKQSENETLSLRTQVQSGRREWVSREEKLEIQIQTLVNKLSEKTAYAESAKVSVQTAKDNYQQAKKEVETIALRVRQLDTQLEAAENRFKKSQEEMMHMKRDHVHEIALKQQEMEKYREELREHYSKCKAVLTREHFEEIEHLRELHDSELSNTLSKAKLEFRRNYEHQRLQFTNEFKSFEEKHQRRIEEMSSDHLIQLDRVHKEHRDKLKDALRDAREEEQNRASHALSESFIQREMEAVHIRRRDALYYLAAIQRSSCTRLMSKALFQWQRFTSAHRSDELIEIYGAAMDQTNGVSKLLVLCSRLDLNACREAFSRWTKYAPGHPKRRKDVPARREPSASKYYYSYSMYPNELIRKIRRKIAQHNFLIHIRNFVGSLQLGSDGKISPRTFHTALVQSAMDSEDERLSHMEEKKMDEFQREQRLFEYRLCAIYLEDFKPPRTKVRASTLSPRQGNYVSMKSNSLEPGEDWVILRVNALTKIASWLETRALRQKGRAFGRILAHASNFTVAPSYRTFKTSPSSVLEGDFMRNMETQALQEEVKALHVQLGASKAEAWKYKRKLVSQYQKVI